ncbi:hypothetical protein Tco_1293574 [Tanacetum coccineum]
MPVAQVNWTTPTSSMGGIHQTSEEKSSKGFVEFQLANAHIRNLPCEPRILRTYFHAIVYYCALTSKLDFLTEPTESPQHIDEFNLKNETSLSECDEKEQNILYFNDLFPFNVIYHDDLKSDKNNDIDEIDIEQSSGDMSVIPLPNVINTDVGAYAHESNKLLETSHDISNKFFKTEIFIKELNDKIVACNYLIKGMLTNLIKNLYVPFGIPFDPKLFYKDGIKLGQV